MKTLGVAVRMLGVMTLLTGVLYPLAVTGMARLAYPRQVEGSLVARDGKTVGSELLAQAFTRPEYFWPRPSAGDFATMPSGAGNKGPTAKDLQAAVKERARKWREAHKLPSDAPVPPDMLFASGSGLDPHISPEAARQQVDRVAAARRFTREQRDALAVLVERHVEGPQWGFLGDPRVIVLRLNLALDRMR